VLAILPVLKIIGASIVAVTESSGSTLAKNSEYRLPVKVEREACPLGLAPTASTTATLAVGDALAIVLLNARKFKAEDFALYHPGGALGRKLLLTVERAMHSGVDNPVISQEATVRDAIILMTKANYGAVMAVDEAGLMTGIITDGDLKRIFEKHQEPLALLIKEVMTKNPKSITKERLAAEAMYVMESKNITVLPVIDEKGIPIGIIQLNNIVKGLTGVKG
jgi:arabinose-5-phosphate isomerase